MEILRVLSIVAAVLLFFACLLIPRRPDVFFHGKVVDNHRATTALHRVTWSWANRILSLASKKGDLTHEDMPYPDHHNRADHLVALWRQLDLNSSLLLSLLWAYRHRIAIQWTFTPIRAIVSFTPYYVMLLLIRFLEQRRIGDPPTPELWAYVFLLGFCTLLDQVIQTPMSSIAVRFLLLTCHPMTVD
jgi:hypothetical protein